MAPLLLVAILTSMAHAGKLIADRADATLRTDGRLQLADNWTMRAGENSAPGAGCIVLPFELPELGMVGKLFETASLRVQLASFTGNVTNFNLDLYALDRVSDKPDVLSEDTMPGSWIRPHCSLPMILSPHNLPFDPRKLPTSARSLKLMNCWPSLCVKNGMMAKMQASSSSCV